MSVASSEERMKSAWRWDWGWSAAAGLALICGVQSVAIAKLVSDAPVAVPPVQEVASAPEVQRYDDSAVLSKLSEIEFQVRLAVSNSATARDVAGSAARAAGDARDAAEKARIYCN